MTSNVQSQTNAIEILEMGLPSANSLLAQQDPTLADITLTSSDAAALQTLGIDSLTVATIERTDDQTEIAEF